jgi:hypothetical protein
MGILAIFRKEVLVTFESGDLMANPSKETLIG